jgi:uncharacterized protein
MNLTFEWDANKEIQNRKKHGVSFEEAATVFDDNLSMIFYDPDHSAQEDRFVILGLSASGRLLVIAFTDRADRVRIISARKPTHKERKFYEEKNRKPTRPR